MFHYVDQLQDSADWQLTLVVCIPRTYVAFPRAPRASKCAETAELGMSNEREPMDAVAVIARGDDMSAAAAVPLHVSHTRTDSSIDEPDDDLAACIAGIHVDGIGINRSSNDGATSSSNPRLYCCTYCNNPSAVLRKCSVCGTARSVLQPAAIWYL